MSMLDDEPSGGRLNPADCVGHLLMVWAVDYIEHSPTKYSQPGKKSDVVVVDVVDLDQADHEGYQGQTYRNVWWRNGRLIGLMKSRIGRPKPVLARMAVGVNTLGKPPFELEFATHDAEAVKRAEAWFQAHPDFRPGAPSPSNPDEARVQAQAPTATPKSQLLMLAENSIARDPHQQALRDTVAQAATRYSEILSTPPLPPARPQAVDNPVDSFTEEAPF